MENMDVEHLISGMISEHSSVTEQGAIIYILWNDDGYSIGVEKT